MPHSFAAEDVMQAVFVYFVLADNPFLLISSIKIVKVLKTGQQWLQALEGRQVLKILNLREKGVKLCQLSFGAFAFALLPLVAFITYLLLTFALRLRPAHRTIG